VSVRQIFIQFIQRGEKKGYLSTTTTIKGERKDFCFFLKKESGEKYGDDKKSIPTRGFLLRQHSLSVNFREISKQTRHPNNTKINFKLKNE
jgi:hypothetical protein